MIYWIPFVLAVVQTAPPTIATLQESYKKGSWSEVLKFAGPVSQLEQDEGKLEAVMRITEDVVVFHDPNVRTLAIVYRNALGKPLNPWLNARAMARLRVMEDLAPEKMADLSLAKKLHAEGRGELGGEPPFHVADARFLGSLAILLNISRNKEGFDDPEAHYMMADMVERLFPGMEKSFMVDFLTRWPKRVESREVFDRLRDSLRIAAGSQGRAGKISTADKKLLEKLEKKLPALP